MTQKFRARVWCFDDDINTDLILPIPIIPLPRMERPKHVFRANRPGWARQVNPGDILIGGKNFGMGSARPAALAMKDLGLSCMVADSINGLFFRNCVNFAFPALEMSGVRAAFDEGDEAEVDFDAATITNQKTGTTLIGSPWPEFALKAMKAGGLIEKLDADGLLHPVGWMPATVEGRRTSPV